MKGWPQNDDPESFWATPVDVAAAKLAEILMEERPQVIMTYNEHGFYGHPDHIQAHRITLAALDDDRLRTDAVLQRDPRLSVR